MQRLKLERTTNTLIKVNWWQQHIHTSRTFWKNGRVEKDPCQIDDKSHIDVTYKRQSIKQIEVDYLGEIPWENTIIVLRDTNLNICPMAWCKEVKDLQLQDKIRLRLTLAGERYTGMNPNVLRWELRCALVELLRRPWVCECSKIRVQATWLQPNNVFLVTHSHAFFFKKKSKTPPNICNCLKTFEHLTATRDRIWQAYTGLETTLEN